MNFELHLHLRSDATFGRGDGVVGLVDDEVEYDAATGLPFLRGRTLKGLLVEECANVLFALQASPVIDRLNDAAKFLFGQAGSTLDDDANLHVGSALMPKDLREAVTADVNAKRLTPAEVLESITAIRRQTAMDEETGAPAEGSLRSMRVVLRNTPCVAQLHFNHLNLARDLDADALALLAACVMSLRRAGTGRNRGRGRLEARLHDESGEITAKHLVRLEQIVKGGAKS
ncbi:hypothetical protein L0337_18835 [candidate division KSB1 bacterium]|nr:hypothetical protein [candidate division KSB1 bacterium]